MKQVIVNTPDIFTNIADVSVDKFYGLESVNGLKAFFIRDTYEGGDWFPVDRDGVTSNRNWGSALRHSTLKSSLQTAIYYGYKVLEFDDKKEFYQWLAQ